MGNINKRQIGAEYEEMAARYLKERGYKILERNYRNVMGEIDIIAWKDNFLVFVEVKYRRTDTCGDPLEAVDWRKQRRICKAALYYYKQHRYSLEQPCRFDVIGIYGNGTVRHVENAFEFVE